MSEELKLLSCPFCGGRAKMERLHWDNGMPEVYYSEWTFYMVCCELCGAATKGHYTESTAREAWNRRKKRFHPKEWISTYHKEPIEKRGG